MAVRVGVHPGCNTKVTGFLGLGPSRNPVAFSAFLLLDVSLLGFNIKTILVQRFPCCDHIRIAPPSCRHHFGFVLIRNNNYFLLLHDVVMTRILQHPLLEGLVERVGIPDLPILGRSCVSIGHRVAAHTLQECDQCRFFAREQAQRLDHGVLVGMRSAAHVVEFHDLGQGAQRSVMHIRTGVFQLPE